MKKTLKKTMVMVLAAALLLALAACGSPSDNVVGSVNGVDITQAEYDYYLADYFDYYYSYYLSYYGMDLSDQETIDSFMPTFLADLEHYSWEQCVEAALLQQVAEEYGVTYDNPFIQEFLPYGEYKYIEASSLFNLIFYSEEAQAAAEAAAQEAYNADPREYRGTSHILITCNVNDEEELAAAYEQAMEVIDMLNNGAAFEEMIAAYSAESTTEYDPIDAEGRMIDGSTTFVKEYADGAFSLSQVGEYTLEPVQTIYGYHIIRLNSIISTFEEAEPYMVDVETFFTDLLTQYKENANVVCNVDFKYYDPNASEEADDADDAADEEGNSGDAETEAETEADTEAEETQE